MGSAKEWPVRHFFEVGQMLSERFNIIITGTKEEGEKIGAECEAIFKLPSIKNACGKFSLKEFIHFIGCADGLLACSTGPLHIAAASGVHALGLYPITRPMHGGRWAPLGTKAFYIEESEIYSKSIPSDKHLHISPKQVYEIIETWST